jgi:ubiquinone/menaquinone biosynthesis C-methylase UbiE
MKFLFPQEYGGNEAEATDRYVEYHWAISMLRHHSITTTYKVLDLGSTGGMFLVLLHAMGYDAQGIDLRPYPVPLRYFTQGDIKKLPFKDKSFDVVTAISTIEHIKQDQKAMAEVWRVLTPRGKLFLSVPFAEKRKRTKFHKIHDEESLHKLLNGFSGKMKYVASLESNKYKLALVDGMKI